ncbi:uncharacterized protein LOC117115666 [Anneissia japonica]|uniref:uncharacterized protein LOC117115666 n=1 Tax=Anneissia japonica TaxID=1529436 RepID=UPI0014256507|nr:uncharacterized protein LOC117115666 [Anneissia japonica]XP_033115451.1 uncharacterized protein LOC117115666 [Anneissia japonica]
MMKFAVVTVLILSCIASAMGLRCYKCHSLTTSNDCEEEGFDTSNALKTTCAYGEVCAKTVVGKLVARDCISGSGLSDSCVSVDDTAVCYCSTDLCNSAVSKNLGFALAFISLVAAKYL